MYNSINNKTVFQPNTLHIFTDASIRTLRTKEQVGCGGCVLVYGLLEDNNIEEFYQIHRRTTNNISEAKALRLGIEQAIRHKYNFNTIRLFSDSQITVFGIRERIFNWDFRSGKYYGSGKDPIKNQELLLEIINMIISYDLKIELYHQAGHIGNNDKDMNYATHLFKNSNRIRSVVSYDFIKTISYFNNMVDSHSRDLLRSIPERDFSKDQFVEPIYFNKLDYDMAKYMSLINYF